MHIRNLPKCGLKPAEQYYIIQERRLLAVGPKCTMAASHAAPW